jgi:hypothetical protein
MIKDVRINKSQSPVFEGESASVATRLISAEPPRSGYLEPFLAEKVRETVIAREVGDRRDHYSCRSSSPRELPSRAQRDAGRSDGRAEIRIAHCNSPPTYNYSR